MTHPDDCLCVRCFELLRETNKALQQSFWDTRDELAALHKKRIDELVHLKKEIDYLRTTIESMRRMRGND